MFSRPEQPWKAASPIFVMLLGIVTLVTLDLFRNALIPTLVTGQPFVALGIVTSLAVPVYLVIEIAPLFVMKVN